MTIKQGFKFLNTLLFSLHQQRVVVLVGRQSLQVLNAIIITSAVQVMYYPFGRKLMAIGLFPDEDVFPDITSGISPGMVVVKNENVTTRRYEPSAFPIRVFITLAMLTWVCFPIFKQVFKIATVATKCFPHNDRFPTVYTTIRFCVFASSLMRTIGASYCPFIDWLTTIQARMFSPLLVFFLCFPHISIIPYLVQCSKLPCRVDEIIAAANKAGIPVFVKEPLASHYGIQRQEFPKGGDSFEF